MPRCTRRARRRPDTTTSTVPLPDADTFVARAIDETGLDDFGAGAWRDGLDVLLDALTREAQLNDFGIGSFDYLISNSLRDRLGVVDWLRRAPEIRAVTIDAPVIVIGLPRTGTTALAHLLATDRDTRSLRTWEESSPTPPPEAATEH